MPITDTLGVDEQRLQVMDAPHLTAFEAPADLSRQGRRGRPRAEGSPADQRLPRQRDVTLEEGHA